jgi:hypothetical protein
VPTSVICMALISVLGFVALGLYDQQLVVGLNDRGRGRAPRRCCGHAGDEGALSTATGPGAPPLKYDLFGLWIAAVPVVAWGAPFGSWLAAQMTTRRLVQFVTSWPWPR